MFIENYKKDDKTDYLEKSFNSIVDNHFYDNDDDTQTSMENSIEFYNEYRLQNELSIIEKYGLDKFGGLTEVEELANQIRFVLDYEPGVNYYYIKHSGIVLCYDKELERTSTAHLNPIPDLNDFKNHLNDPVEQMKLKGIIINIDAKLEIKDIEKYLLSEDLRNFLFVALPNSGKTEATIMTLLQNKVKFIFIVPLVVMARQIEQKYGVKAFYGKWKKPEPSELNQFVATYDAFQKLHGLLVNSLEYYLIIDEFHKLVTDSDYRYKAVRFIWEKMGYYKKIIGLTGTPYLCYSDATMEEYNIHPIKYLNSNRVTANIIYKMMILKDKADKCINILISKIIELSKSQKVIVFYNNKTKLDFIQDYLITKKYLNDNQLLIINADRKNDPEFQFIIKEEKFSDDIKVVLCTSVISTGINLKDASINNVIIFNESNLVEVVQFIYRFREINLTIYDYNYFTNDSQYFDLESKVSASWKNFKIHLANLNNENKQYSNYYLNEVLKYDMIKKEIVYKINNEYKIYKNWVRNIWLRVLHQRISSDLLMRGSYIQKYIKVGIQYEYECLSELDPNDFKDVPKNFDKLKKRMFDALKNDIDFLLSVVLQTGFIEAEKRINSESLFRQIKTVNFRQNMQKTNYYKEIFSQRKLKEKLIDFLIILGIGVRVKTAIEIIEGDLSKKLIKALEYLTIIPFYDIPEISWQNFSSDQIKLLQDFRPIHEYIKKTKDLSFVELASKLKANKKNNPTTDYFGKCPYERLRYIYLLKANTKKERDADGRRKSGEKFYRYHKVHDAVSLFNELKINIDAEEADIINRYLRNRA